MSSKIIAAVARIEQNAETNGNEEPNQGKTLGKLLGNKARDGKGNEVEVSDHPFISPYNYKYVLRLDDKPVMFSELKKLDPMLRVTKGLYMIKYMPRSDRNRKRGRPWKIGQDLIRWDIRVSGSRHWAKLCESVPELGWIVRNSTFTDALFDIAAQHPGMSLWFSVDWARYEAKIQSQLQNEEQKKDLVRSRVCSVEDYQKLKEQTDNAVVIRVFNDILKEVNDAERMPEVQEEMIAEDGEVYNRSRKNKHDPATGQFIKKKED